MKLRLHFLNAGKGLSVVVEAIKDGDSFFGVIDSHVTGKTEPPALRKLRELGATRLSFICMTHTHDDHYLGLPSVIDAFKGHIQTFYSCPLGDLLLHKDRFKKLATRLIQWAETTDSPEEKRKAFDLVRILRWAEQECPEWLECGGEYSQIAPAGFEGITCYTVQPPLHAKGRFFARIDNGDPLMVGTSDDNEVSIALTFTLGGKTILVGGDATLANWDWRKLRFEDRGGSRINATVVNFPHHGSRYDNKPHMMENLFSTNVEDQRYGVISANGQSHPDFEVIEWQRDNNVAPFCTNLHRRCGASVASFVPMPEIDGVLAKTLREAAVDSNVQQPCQGDITVELDEFGKVNILPQFDTFCPYRMNSLNILGM